MVSADSVTITEVYSDRFIASWRSPGMEGRACACSVCMWEGGAR